MVKLLVKIQLPQGYMSLDMYLWEVLRIVLPLVQIKAFNKLI